MKQADFDELPRLSEGADPVLSRAVAGLRAHRPDVTELSSLASQLSVRGIPTASPAAAPPGGSPAWKKWAVAGGGAASGLVLWWALREPAPSPAPVDPPRETASERAPRASVLAEPAPTAPQRPVAASPSARRARGELTAVPALEAPLPAPHAAAPSRIEAPSPRAPRSSRTTTELAPPRAETPARPSAGIATNRSAAEAASAVATPTEIELLRDARLALRSSPTRALELAESHARFYPNGKLTQERELIAISALVSLGRRTAALSRASRFEQTFPQSPYRKQISDWLR